MIRFCLQKLLSRNSKRKSAIFVRDYAESSTVFDSKSFRFCVNEFTDVLSGVGHAVTQQEEELAIGASLLNPRFSFGSCPGQAMPAKVECVMYRAKGLTNADFYSLTDGTRGPKFCTSTAKLKLRETDVLALVQAASNLTNYVFLKAVLSNLH